jgi:hypothetical protein
LTNLELEAPDARFTGALLGQQLHGGGAPQHGVPRAVHDTHSPRAEARFELVLPEAPHLLHLAPEPVDHA